jgi:hypothetical protein
MKFVLQRVELSAMINRLKCTAFSVVSYEKLFIVTPVERKCVATKFGIALATADLRGSDTDLL